MRKNYCYYETIYVLLIFYKTYINYRAKFYFEVKNFYFFLMKIIIYLIFRPKLKKNFQLPNLLQYSNNAFKSPSLSKRIRRSFANSSI